MTTCLELSLPAVPASVRHARDAVGELAPLLGPVRLYDVRLCVSEAVTNAVRHAYDEGPGNVAVVVTRDAHEIVVAVRDEGVGLSRFRRDGAIGYGLRIIDELADRCAISSAPGLGTEVEMAFAVETNASLV